MSLRAHLPHYVPINKIILIITRRALTSIPQDVRPHHIGSVHIIFHRVDPQSAVIIFMLIFMRTNTLPCDPITWVGNF